MAVVPSVVAQDKIYVSTNAGPSALAGAKCNANYFNAAYQNDNLHEAVGNYANTAGYKKSFILAPNYPAGTDALTGYKRFYKGELAGEVYTKVGQTDYAAEIAQIRASGADSVYFFLPGGMGVAFMKQYSQSGVTIPVTGPGFSFDQDVLGAIGDAALGVKNSSHWSKDLDNEANKAYVEAFKKEYGRLPSLYATQGYDAANLILSAAAKASINDKDAFRAAMKAADFKSVRGKFKFGNNNHPIQDIYMREVIKEDGVLTNKIVATSFTDHQDTYAKDCKL
jgi:branched-chain amino acid transport system substrate-binding protein